MFASISISIQLNNIKEPFIKLLNGSWFIEQMPEKKSKNIDEAYELFENKRDGVIKVAVEC